MKPIRSLITLITLALISGGHVLAQADSTGLPGDQFSLEGALALFKKANSPEEFEKMLNSEDNHVNNLDLDGDGQIDYIRVIGKKDGDAQAYILQVSVSDNESQDVAVIELEKTGSQSAILQIVGDPELYGDETLVEPQEADQAFVPGAGSLRSGPYDESYNSISGDNAYRPGVVVNVWFWPCVRYVYAPGYRLWVSPWRWHAYPAWWRPWRPMGWHVWHPYRVHYRSGFVVVHTNRVVHAHRLYTPVRTTSVTVRSRNATAMGHYRVTHRTTTVTGPRGNSATRKTTTVHSRRGVTRHSSTTVKRKRRG